MKAVLWRAMLDSDFNSRYWRCVTEKYSERDFALKIFLAVSASGTVAGWSLWSDNPLAWKVVSGMAALASIASPLLGLGKKAEVAASHAGFWADLRVRYADLWDTYQSKGETDSLQREHARLRKVFTDLEKKEAGLKIPRDQRLARKCQEDVLRSKGLLRRVEYDQPSKAMG
jgi:hypothetical protein